MRCKSIKRAFGITGLALAYVAGCVFAADLDRTVAGDAQLSKDDVIRALYVDLEQAAELKKRGLQPVRRALAFDVKFDLNSANLNSVAVQTLRPVGEALHELSPQPFVIEGHTDATGSRSYNQKLSERRAAAVKRFLASEYQIDKGLLTSVGKGPDDPLDRQHPASGINRRVEIVTR